MREYFGSKLETPFHIYNRGTEKRIIFTDYVEYCRFIFLMWVCRIGKPINLSRKNVIEAAEAILRGKRPSPSLYIREPPPFSCFCYLEPFAESFPFYTTIFS